MAVTKVTDASFDQDVLKNSLPVLVDFYADWCGPCKMAEPVLEELSVSYKDKLVILKLNVDENNVTPSKYGVMSIPTTIFFKGGNEIERQVGFGGKQKFEELIKKFVWKEVIYMQDNNTQPTVPVDPTNVVTDQTAVVPVPTDTTTVTPVPEVVTETTTTTTVPAPVETPVPSEIPEVPSV